MPSTATPVLGLSISLGIAALASLPMLARLDRLGIQTVLWNTFLIAATAFSCWLLHGAMAFPDERRDHPWPWKIASLFLGAALSALYNHPAILQLRGHGRLLDELGPGARWVVVFFRGMLISGVLFLARYYIDLSSRAQRERLENERLLRENLQTRLSSLQDRLSPHFLFNALATLRGIAQNDEAKEYVSRLADVYRRLLGRGDEPTSTLRDELSFLDSYLHILSGRFETALRIERDLDESLLDRRLPALSLQVLVENAVKHNVVSASRPLAIAIRARDGEVVVENSLQPRLSVEEGTGSGLGGLAQRYRLLAGAEISVERKDGRFAVRLPLLP